MNDGDGGDDDGNAMRGSLTKRHLRTSWTANGRIRTHSTCYILANEGDHVEMSNRIINKSIYFPHFP